MKISLIESVLRTSSKSDSETTKRDKLAQTKLRERELRQQHKNQLAKQKVERKKQEEVRSALQKEERMANHDTCRARRERRIHARREEARAYETSDQHPSARVSVCGHGVRACKLCKFP
jgi:hypothetical protein